jgi:hypothetical protein
VWSETAPPGLPLGTKTLDFAPENPKKKWQRAATKTKAHFQTKERTGCHACGYSCFLSVRGHMHLLLSGTTYERAADQVDPNAEACTEFDGGPRSRAAALCHTTVVCAASEWRIPKTARWLA